MNLLNALQNTLWFILPAYFASISPVWFKLEGKTPLDFGKKFRGRRIFGPSKTIKGYLGGALCGAVLGALQEILFKKPNGLALGILLGLGALTGDAIKSFFKRQRNIPPGKLWFPFDQIDFLVGGIIFAAIIESPSPLGIIILFIITPPLHVLSNIIDYKIGLKKVPY